ncbi:MAG: TrmH family RNA methyltransferase, partial [Phycisphaerae bacterium]
HDFRGPTAIVIGSEWHGIRPALLKCCDALVRIPQHGRIGSLNSAAAAAVVFYEARRQRSESR